MKRFVKSMVRSPTGLTGFFLVALIGLAAVLAPVIAPYDPVMQNLVHRLIRPFTAKDGCFYLFGTDELGRDIFSRLLWGMRLSYVVGPLSVLLGGFVGVVLGLIAGYYRGIVDRVITWAVDVQLSFPILVISIALVAVFGQSTVNLVLILSITSWLYFARIVRSSVLSLREQDYIEAERAMGASDFQIIVKHILPNCTSPIIVLASTEAARRIIMESSLSFLGCGIQPPAISLGLIIGSGRTYMLVAWWISTIPGIFLALFVLGINLFANFMRDYFDPKTK